MEVCTIFNHQQIKNHNLALTLNQPLKVLKCFLHSKISITSKLGENGVFIGKNCASGDGCRLLRRSRDLATACRHPDNWELSFLEWGFSWSLAIARLSTVWRSSPMLCFGILTFSCILVPHGPLVIVFSHAFPFLSSVSNPSSRMTHKSPAKS